MPLQEKVAKRIHELRLSKAMTQEQLAEKANMDVSMLARIERGSRGDIRMGTLDRIINGLGVTYQEFFTFGDDENQATRLASSISLIQDPDILTALQKIVDSITKPSDKHS